MDSSQQDDQLLSSPESSQVSLTSFGITPSSYLTVPSTRPSGPLLSLPGPAVLREDDTELLLPSTDRPSPSGSVPLILEPSRITTPRERQQSPSPSRLLPPPLIYMSVYSSTSTDSEFSVYSNPPARVYRVPSFQKMSGSRKISAVCLVFLVWMFQGTAVADGL